MSSVESRAAPLSSANMRRSALSAVQSLRLAAIRYRVPRLALFMSPVARALRRVKSAIRRRLKPGRALSAALSWYRSALLPRYCRSCSSRSFRGAVASFALNGAASFRQMFYERWPSEPEVGSFFSDNLGQAIGEPFRGSIMFWHPDYPTLLTMASLWARGIPTINEYSQLVTPQALYFIHMLFKKNVLAHLNWFQPNLTEGTYSKTYWDALRMFGVRYFMGPARVPEADGISTARIELPHKVIEKEPPSGKSTTCAGPTLEISVQPRSRRRARPQKSWRSSQRRNSTSTITLCSRVRSASRSPRRVTCA